MQKTKSNFFIHASFAVFFLSLVLFCAALIHSNNQDNGTVTVTCDGAVFGIFEVNDDQLIDVNGKMTIRIKDQKVWVESSVCAGQDCKKQGYLSEYPIVCLPNRIEIAFTNPNIPFDAVVE